MPRTPKTRSRAKASDHIDFESDNEELRDEIDKFHDEKTKIKPGSYRRAQKAQAEEVLNVEGDKSDVEVADSGEDSSDFDNDDAGISSNQWGRKRQDHYSTDFVDQDWGGMRDEEMEAAELEEEDALARQKELDRAAAQLADDLDDDDDETAAPQKKEQISKNTELEWTFPTVKKLNKETTKLLEEYRQRKDLMTIIVEPLEAVMRSLPPKAVLRKQLQMVIDVYSKYLLDLAFLLKEKTASFEKQQIKDAVLAEHPVNEEYLRSKMMIKKVDDFLDKNSDNVQKLLEMVQKGDNLTDISLPEISKKKPSAVTTAAEEIAEMGLEDEEQEGEAGADGKRKALGSIAKNSKSIKTKKKKEKHAKVANRRKYKEIQKKVRSQVGKIRQETEKYTGEARGIRASTIKSVKLIA